MHLMLTALTPDGGDANRGKSLGGPLPTRDTSNTQFLAKKTWTENLTTASASTPVLEEGRQLRPVYYVTEQQGPSQIHFFLCPSLPPQQ